MTKSFGWSPLQMREHKKRYMAEWHKNNKEKIDGYRRKAEPKATALSREFLMRVKDAPCMDCGGRFHHSAMEFDHVRGRKKFMISARRSPHERLEEIKKCDLVCANCHAIRTFQRRDQGRHAERVREIEPDRQARLFE